MNIIATHGGTTPVTMTSLALVDFINEDRKQRAHAIGAPFPGHGFPSLEHKNFLAKVIEVLGDGSAKFSADLPDSYGRPRRGYRFPKREACLMAMSYSYELQAKVFDRMTELESQSMPQVPKTMAQALRLAADQAEQIERQEAALALAAPKVEFVDRYVQADTGAKGFRQVAKLLQAKEPEFRQFLTDNKIMYKLGDEWTAYQNHIDAGRFEVKTGVAGNEHAYNSVKFTPKGIAWIAGEWGKHLAAKAQA